ncbi:MAG: folylpolyglutamate synthase/dihydrofolate synthase family protein [Myxococcota bacterium]|nr:folylpolyglutamate synthase/dihydrofolate synthase family protein [Myxococcota bacterium]
MRSASDTVPWSIYEAEAWLDGLRPRGIQLGLDRVRRALEALGSPDQGMAAVTIAGTNGKGSTAAFLASIVHAGGYRVGLYTSPHLVDVTERIQVGGVTIAPADFARWTARIRAVVEGGHVSARSPGPSEGSGARHSGIPLTYFEALTVLALCYFREREVDLVVLEVGLGGRLDATAVVDPLVSVVTPIGFDHQAFLGATLEAIAREKAGIIKPGSTLVTNVDRDLFRTVLGPAAFAKRCPIRREGIDYRRRWLHRGVRYRGWLHRVGPVTPGLAGVLQADNAALACAAAEVLCDHGFSLKAVHLAEGIQRARHVGRLDRRANLIDQQGRRWPVLLMDGAHNPMAATVLAQELPGLLPERPRVALFSARPDKDIAGMIAQLGPHLDRVVVTNLPDQAPPPLDALVFASRRYAFKLTVEPYIPSALELARRHAGPDGGMLVTGSLYLIGQVLPLLPGGARRAA